MRRLIAKIAAVVVVVLAGLAAAPVACEATTRNSAQAVAVQSAYNTAVGVLTALDAADAAYLDSLDVPTDADLAAAGRRLSLATMARDALGLAADAVRAGDVEGARAALLTAIAALDKLVAELDAVGVPVPPAARRGMQLLHAITGAAGA